MSRTCGKRWVVAAAGVAALAWLGAGRTDAQQAAFARITVSEKSVVYIRIQGGELRAAMSAEGLQTAAPVKMSMSSTRVIAFPEFTLPVPADQLPAGVKAIKATLSWERAWMPAADARASPVSRAMIEGILEVSGTDDQKAEWQYGSVVNVEAAANVEKASSVALPTLDNTKVVLSAEPSEGRLAIGLLLKAAGEVVADVRKDGQPVQAKVVIADASGAEIASKVGTLADFGFS
jgi:hypothetical protein